MPTWLRIDKRREISCDVPPTCQLTFSFKPSIWQFGSDSFDPILYIFGKSPKCEWKEISAGTYEHYGSKIHMYFPPY